MLALDRTDASAAASRRVIKRVAGRGGGGVRDRDALQKSSERQVLNAERRCEHAEKVPAEAERRAAAAEEAAEARASRPSRSTSRGPTPWTGGTRSSTATW